MTSEYIRVSEEYRMANGRAARTTSAATAVRRARIGSRWPSASGRPPMRRPAQNASGSAATPKMPESARNAHGDQPTRAPQACRIT